jgi:enediyne biosynthesis protein E4
MNRLVLALALTVGAPAFAQSVGDGPIVPQFVEETRSSGITSVYAGDWQYMVGGGVAVFDCNDDGLSDIYLAGGEDKAAFFRNTSTVGGSLTFAKAASGLEVDKVLGAYPLDVNSDGIMDLAVLRVGENLLMRGAGNCKFENANARWHFTGGDGWSTAFSATWEKGRNWPTLAIGDYIDRTNDQPWGSCTGNYLYRPQPTHRGFDAPSRLDPAHCPLSMLFTDWNRSGTPSLRISNDREYYEGGQEQMWKIPADAPPSLYSLEEGWRYVRLWGMGIASVDLNGDRYPEYYLSSMGDQHLQMLAEVPAAGAPKPGYVDVPYDKGLTAHRPYVGGDMRPSTGWHTQFEDVNNDGMWDLFVAKGNVDRMPDFAEKDPNNLLVQAADGKFIEMGDKAGVASMASARGAMVADFNADGLQDLVVVNRRESAQIWRNTTAHAGHWLSFKLAQAGVNRNAVGAWVEVKANGKVSSREMFLGGGHVSGVQAWTQFGLGAATSIELRVTWPDGVASEWMPLAADQHYVISRETGAVAQSFK